MSVRRFRKKPVEVVARLVPEVYSNGDDRGIMEYVSDCVELAEWCGGISQMMEPPEGTTFGIYIPTLEGEMRADPGDWIIQGVKGEFYPCKPDIFEETYDEVIDELPKVY